MYGLDFRFTFPRMKRGERASKTFRLSSCSSGFSRRCAAGKVLLGWWFLSFTLSLSLFLFLGVVRSRSCSPVVALPVADYRRRTCHRRRLLFRKSETIASAGVCLTEVPRFPGGCAPRIYRVKRIRFGYFVHTIRSERKSHD